MAIVIAVLAVWGFTNHHPLFILGLAVSGALGYFAGLVIALVLSVGLLVANIFSLFGSQGFHMSIVMVETMGYIGISWLGYRHRVLKRIQQKLVNSNKPNQIVPWAMVNEVRTSLAAIRFLLFPLHEENRSQELQQATSELSRLESLFQQMERNQQNSDVAEKQHR